MSRAASRALERRARDVIVRCPSSIGRPLSSSSTREHVLPGGVETMSILRSSTSSGEIFLVGTAHVSQRSAREVRELVRLVKPTTVCVELCEERLRTMREKIEREKSGRDPLRMLLRGRLLIAGLGPLHSHSHTHTRRVGNLWSI